MKFVLSLVFMLGAISGFAQTTPGSEKLWINQETHDFGTIPQGTPVFTNFILKGLGDSLKLEMVQAGCGCTTPEFKAGAYAPNMETTIKVGFNAAALGQFNKPITITYNDGQQKVIFIKGVVQAAPQSAAPQQELVKRIKP